MDLHCSCLCNIAFFLCVVNCILIFFVCIVFEIVNAVFVEFTIQLCELLQHGDDVGKIGGSSLDRLTYVMAIKQLLLHYSV